MENRQKRIRKNFHDFFFFKNVRLQIFFSNNFFSRNIFSIFLYYFALWASGASCGGCRRAKRTARRRPRCRSLRLRQQRVCNKKLISDKNTPYYKTAHCSKASIRIFNPFNQQNQLNLTIPFKNSQYIL